MLKYPKEFKLEVVKYYLESGMGYLRVAKHFNMPSSVTVLNWVRRYKEHGEDGLVKNPDCTYSGNFKLAVIQYMHRTHSSYIETSMHFNLGSGSVVKEWEDIYSKKGPNALERKKKYKKSAKKKKKNMKFKPKKVNKKALKKKSQDELIDKIEQLEMENAYLKKLHALVQERTKPKQEKK